mgnify:CR=1 FL=1
MSVLIPNRKGIVAAAFAIVMNSIPLSAQTPDLQDESALLSALVEADEAEARKLARQLQRLWSMSGSASMDLLLERGQDALEAEDYASAVDHLTALTDHAPDFAEGWSARASAFYQLERYGLALADLERALALNPNNYTAIFGLGAILETLGDSKRAYEAYRRAKAIHPHFEDVTKAMDRLRSEVEGKTL